MTTTSSAWLTDNKNQNRFVTHLVGTLAGGVLYALLATSCGVDPEGRAVPEHFDAPVTSEVRTTAPEVVAAMPEAVANPDVIAKVVFSTQMQDDAQDAVTLTSETELLAVSAAWDTSHTVLALRPLTVLGEGDYVLTVDTSAKNSDGVGLAAPFATSFAVMMQPSKP